MNSLDRLLASHGFQEDGLVEFHLKVKLLSFSRAGRGLEEQGTKGTNCKFACVCFEHSPG